MEYQRLCMVWDSSIDVDFFRYTFSQDWFFTSAPSQQAGKASWKQRCLIQSVSTLQLIHKHCLKVLLEESLCIDKTNQGCTVSKITCEEKAKPMWCHDKLSMWLHPPSRCNYWTLPRWRETSWDWSCCSSHLRINNTNQVVLWQLLYSSLKILVRGKYRLLTSACHFAKTPLKLWALMGKFFWSNCMIAN